MGSPSTAVGCHHTVVVLHAHDPSRVGHVVRKGLGVPHALLQSLRVTGVLEDMRFAMALGAAGLALALALFVVRRRPRFRGLRHQRLVTALVTTVAVLAVVCGCAVGVNAYVGYYPTVSALFGGDLGAGTGQVLTIEVPGGGLAAGTNLVYLPPGYDAPGNAHRHYPVLYLISGFPGSPEDWFRAGRAAESSDALLAGRDITPMIIVSSPEHVGLLSDTECLNVPGGPQLETYLTHTVVGAIDRRFRTLAHPADRAIGGMSAGADCALNLALRHQGEYGAVFAALPTGEPGGTALRGVLHGDEAVYRANAPIDYLPHLRVRRRFPVLLDVGGADPHDVATTLRLKRLLEKRGFPTTLRIDPGQGHTWREARLSLPYGLVFTSDAFSGQHRAVASHIERLVCSLSKPAPRPTPVAPVAGKRRGFN